MLDRWKDSTDLSLHWRLTGTAPLLGRWALWPDAIVTDSLSLLAGQRFRCALQPRACRWLMSHCVQAALYVAARHAQLFIKLI